MKKEIIKILKELGLEIIKIDYWKPAFDHNNYEVWYKNKNGKEFYWYGRTDNYLLNEDDDIESRVGFLRKLKEDVSKNI